MNYNSLVYPFFKISEYKKGASNIFICIIPFTIMVKRNKQYFHSYDTFYYNNQKSNKQNI